MAGVVVGWVQLSKIASQLGNDRLMAVLEMDAQLNARKEKLDDLQLEIINLGKNPLKQDAGDIDVIDEAGTRAKLEDLNRKREVALENYHNALDRLCFCISKNYLPETYWKAEWREYVTDAVKTNPNSFGTTTRFRNVMSVFNALRGT